LSQEKFCNFKSIPYIPPIDSFIVEIENLAYLMSIESTEDIDISYIKKNTKRKGKTKRFRRKHKVTSKRLKCFNMPIYLRRKIQEENRSTNDWILDYGTLPNNIL